MNRHPAPPKPGAPLPGNIRIREYGDADRAMLGALWSSVFGDPPSLMADFLRLLPEMGSCNSSRMNFTSRSPLPTTSSMRRARALDRWRSVTEPPFKKFESGSTW